MRLEVGREGRKGAGQNAKFFFRNSFLTQHTCFFQALLL